MANKRVFYAIKQVQLAPDNTGPSSYSAAHVIHGLQSIGITTKFNLDQIFEIGQLAIYENIENVPDIEITLEKVIDGYAPIWHLATPNATSATLVGRSTVKCQLLMTIYDDTKDSASGTPISETECSGLFISSHNINLQVEGSFTEGASLVGNNKIWRSSPSGTGRFPGNNDTPLGTGGVQRREDILFGSGYSILPSSIRGVTAIGAGSGYVVETSGVFGASIQSIRTSVNLGREQLLELGRRKPYFRYVTFPVEVRTDIESYCKDGDFVQALEDGDNLTNEKIYILLREGTIIDLGVQNKLDNVVFGGGNAGKGGGNDTITYTYVTYNDYTIKHPQDPAGLTYP